MRNMIDDNPLMRWLWPLLASLAGAITALSFRPYAKMTPVDIIMALFVGSSFAWFVSPWVNHLIFGSGPTDIRILGGVFYLMASGSNILIPVMVRRLRKLVGAQSMETEA